MRPRLWDCIERQPGLSAVCLDRQQMLGEDYKYIESYLRPTDRLATTIPCRVGCTPCCRRRVVHRGPDDVVAICNDGDPKYAVDEMDLISHELNLGSVCRNLCSALDVDPAIEQVTRLHQTWQCGFVKSRQAIRHPVYLSIQMEEQQLVEVALRLATMNRKPMVLLLPTTRRVSDLVRHVLESNQTGWKPLDRSVGWSSEGRMITDVNLAEMLVPIDHPETTTKTEQPTPEIDSMIVIERRIMGD